MRILVTRFPLESAYGGAEIQTSCLMKGLKEKGNELLFLGSCPIMQELSKLAGMETHELDIGTPPVTKWGALSFTKRQEAMRTKLCAALDELKPNAVIMMSMSEKILLTEYAHTSGVQVFWLEHDRVGPWLTRNPWLPKLRKVSSMATTVCVSQLSADIYAKLGWNAEHIAVIPNGVDAKRFPERHELQDSKILHIGCIARLTHDKGVDVLIRAIADLPNTRLTVVGSGRDEIEIRALISELCLTERVTILPEQKNLGTFYSEIDCLVLPSREHDPYGLVAAEAMCIGTPVIVTDQCGIFSQLTDGTDALVVKADSVDSLYEALQKMEDFALRKTLVFQAKRTAKNEFGTEKMIERYSALLNEDAE